MEIDAENLSATELRLGLPGTSSGSGSGDDGSSRSPKKASSAVVGAKRALDDTSSEAAAGDDYQDHTAPPAKTQVVGWPPVRAYRKNNTFLLQSAAAAASKKQPADEKAGGGGGGGLYVKVSMDGAPYLRKVDLRTCKGYRDLREALDALFFATTKSSFSSSGAEGGDHHQVAYEDKDGDLMLAGDVPWEMFVSSCRKLRIIRGGGSSAEATTTTTTR